MERKEGTSIEVVSRCEETVGWEGGSAGGEAGGALDVDVAII
jgi:hypothetical protein